MSLVHTALSCVEDLAHIFSRRPVDHYIEGRWERDGPSATNSLQALQLVEGLEELSRQMRLITGDLLQSIRVWKHAFPFEAILLSLHAPTEHLDGGLQPLHLSFVLILNFSPLLRALVRNLSGALPML
jgi:hypothetical protein